MKMTESEIKDIALKFFQGKATQEEEKLLHQWYEEKGLYHEELLTVHTNNDNIDDVKERLFASIQSKVESERQTAVVRQLPKKIGFITIAASLLIFLFLGGTYFYSYREVGDTIRYTQLLDGDVGPGGNNAILKLGDGRIVNLDAAAIGEVGNSGGMSVSKQADGVLSIEYTSLDVPIEMNTIKTPAGGQYQVKLSDGSKVWLNASSSITFPNAFAKEYREVELEGEAYFEVAKVQNDDNSRIPFFVLNKDQQIEVLGTHFNVYNYPGEPIRTTLLEGSVRVYSMESSTSQLLKPGQQSQIVNGGIKVKSADMDSSLAWKNGDFIFNNEELTSIMKKLERWYDIEVEYTTTVVPRKFSGAVSRTKNLSEVLKIIEYTGKVTFKIEGRRVTVMM